MLANYHTHTSFCDGKHSPEEIVRAAIDRGFSAIGFSAHCYTPFDLSYCMRDTEGYFAEINRLKQLYGNRIEIYLGIEEDAWAPIDRSRVDYLIGSCHYLKKDGTYHSIDYSPDTFSDGVRAFGDIYSYAKNYYDVFCDYLEKRRPDIIGHFDLVTKFTNELTADKDYLALALAAAERAAETECIFEVNTGAMARGIKTAPYPQEEILFLLKKKEARLILSSDSHSIETLDFAFDEVRALLKDVGFCHSYILSDGNFVKESL